jgi:hypothetical protein
MAAFWLFVGFTIGGPFLSLQWDSWLRFPWEPFGLHLAETELGRASGGQLWAWAEFAGRMLPFIFVAALALAGNGVSTLMLSPHASVTYTLTLPVSRTRLIWTRLVAGLGVAVAAGALACAVGAAILIARGHSVPLVPVAQSFALAVALVATLLTVLGALVTSTPHWLAMLAFLAVFLSTMVPISYTVAAPARGAVPWGPLAACLVIIPLAIAFTVYRVSAQEY